MHIRRIRGAARTKSAIIVLLSVPKSFGVRFLPKHVRKVTNIILGLMIAGTLSLGGLRGGNGPLQTAQASSPVVDLYASAPDAPDAELQAIVDDVVSDLQGDWGVAIKKLDTGQYATYNGDDQQVSASLYKMWVLADLYRQAKQGDISLDGYESVSGEDAYYDASI